MKAFVQRHASQIEGVVSGFDRLRFRGTVRLLACWTGMQAFLSHQSVLLKEFSAWAEQLTRRLCEGVEQVAARAGRRIEYLHSSRQSKEQRVDEILQQCGVGAGGLIAVLSCVEPCQSYEVFRNRDRKMLELHSRQRKCLHHYLYLVDPVFGRLHVRLQSWLPFNVHICLNGREWLSRQLDSARLGYLRKDNCFVRLEDAARTQQLADRQVRIDWIKHLDRLLGRANPTLRSLFPGFPLEHYWSAEQTEWATDVMFRNATDLADLYPSLIEHGMRTFGSRDVMRFLGRKVPASGGIYGQFAGEVVSDLAQRTEGLRIKHRVNHNAIKMYDKQGSVLRVETTINDAHDLKAFRAKEGDPQGPKTWRKLRKGVADLPRRARLSQAANQRYLQALAAADSPLTLHQLTAKLGQPVLHGQRRVRALQPLSGDDLRLLQTVLRGEFAISGFRNRDLRALLCAPAAEDPALRRRQAAQIGRQLFLLKAHGLIYKVPGSHRYLLTTFGTQAATALLAASQASVQKLVAAA
jgi:hypothetical protein